MSMGVLVLSERHRVLFSAAISPRHVDGRLGGLP